MYRSVAVATLSVIFAIAALPACAIDAFDSQNDLESKTAAQVHKGRGVVNKINGEAGKVNITHEAILSLKWPKMTMDFGMQEKSLLAEIKPGMKVDFELVKFMNVYQIVRIVSVKE